MNAYPNLCNAVNLLHKRLTFALLSQMRANIIAACCQNNSGGTDGGFGKLYDAGGIIIIDTDFVDPQMWIEAVSRLRSRIDNLGVSNPVYQAIHNDFLKLCDIAYYLGDVNRFESDPIRANPLDVATHAARLMVWVNTWLQTPDPDSCYSCDEIQSILELDDSIKTAISTGSIGLVELSRLIYRPIYLMRDVYMDANRYN